MLNDKDREDHIKRALTINNDIIKQLRWLLNAFVSDFFIKSLATEVKPGWWEVLKQLEPDELATLLCADWKSKLVWPLSLMAYRCAVLSASLNTRPGCKGHLKTTHLTEKHRYTDKDCFSTPSQFLALDHCYRKHVKPKKQHEILQLAQAIHELGEATDCLRVVDVGGGHGHLSRLLAFGYGMETITLDAAGCHNPKAQKFDSEAKFDLLKKKKKLENVEPDSTNKRERMATLDGSFSPSSPQHLTAWIDPSVSVDRFLDVVNQCRSSQGNSTKNFPKIESGREDSAAVDDQSSSAMASDCYCSISQQSKPCDNYIHQVTMSDTEEITTLCESDESSSLCVNCRNHRCTNASVQQFNNVSDKRSSGVSKQSCPIEPYQSSSHRLDPTDSKESSKTLKRYTDEQDCRTIPLTSLPNEQRNNLPQTEDFLLTGLHACGDLTTTLLRLFAECPKVKGIAVVGCCYMKLSTDTSISDGSVGFPMSSFVKNLPDHDLSYDELELACHFVDAYCGRLRDKSQLTTLKSHCYRAALQEVVLQKEPHFRPGCIKFSMKNLDGVDFKSYADKGLRKLGLNPSLSAEQLEKAEERLNQWKEVVAFYTLRLSVAPLVESFILLDRWLYLHEKGISCDLVPLFDPQISPRNVALIARKQGLRKS